MAEATTPKTQTKAGAEDDRVARLEALVIQQTDELANLRKLIAAERPATLPAVIEQEREAYFARMTVELGKTCEQRTQEEAERRWGADTRARWQVKVGYMPAMIVPARSREEAKGRYDALMGIRAVDSEHEYQITQANAA